MGSSSRLNSVSSYAPDPRSRRIVIDHAKHFFQEDAPEEVANAIRTSMTGRRKV